MGWGGGVQFHSGVIIEHLLSTSPLATVWVSRRTLSCRNWRPSRKQGCVVEHLRTLLENIAADAACPCAGCCESADYEKKLTEKQLTSQGHYLTGGHLVAPGNTGLDVYDQCKSCCPRLPNCRGERCTEPQHRLPFHPRAMVLPQSGPANCHRRVGVRAVDVDVDDSGDMADMGTLSPLDLACAGVCNKAVVSFHPASCNG